MELRQLRYFVVVAEELHFSRAAERLHIAQQPLSFQIKQLEEELGVQLFHRTTRRVKLTDAGQLFLNEAKLALYHLERGVEAAQSAQRGERGQLVVGYSATTLYKLLPPTVRRFRERFPAIELVLQERHPALLEQHLLSGELDIGLLIREDMEAPLTELTWQTICTEGIVVALPKDHPLASCACVPLRALASEPFVIYGRRQKRRTYDWIIAECHQVGFSPNIVQEAASEQAIISLVAAGVGVSLVVGCISSLQTNEVRYRPLVEPAVEVDFVAAWRRDYLSSPARALLETAHEVAGEIAAVK